MSDTLVFIPAWNEENIGPVIEELHSELPEADVLVVDDGSTDDTAAVARGNGAEVLSLGANRGLPIGIASGYHWALDHGYDYCGRVDADGQHPAVELGRLLARVRDGDCDVAVGSRFVPGEGYEPYRYLPSPARRFGTALLRRAMGTRSATAVRRRDERIVRRQREGSSAAGPALQNRGSRSRSSPSSQRRGSARRRGAGADGTTRERRLEASWLEGPQSHSHGDRHTRRGPVPTRATVEMNTLFVY